MDFVIGGIPPSGRAGDKSDVARGQLEARVLSVRAPRRREKEGGQEKRRQPGKKDPPGARVLVLLVPDAHKLPRDLESEDYRVFLRFSKTR